MANKDSKHIIEETNKITTMFPEDERLSKEPNTKPREKTINIRSNKVLNLIELTPEEKKHNSKHNRLTFRENEYYTSEFDGSPFAQFEEEDDDDKEEQQQIEINYQKPKDIEDIMKIEDPFYRCSTIISPFYNQTNRKSVEMKKESPFALSNTQNQIDQTVRDDASIISSSTLISENNPEIIISLTLNTVDSLIMTILQVINCTIKYTLVQMAFCVKTLGLIGGPVAMLVIAFIGLYSLSLLMEVKRITGENSYLAFTEKMFGKSGKFIILLLNFISAYGSCLSFIIIFLKVVPNMVAEIEYKFMTNQIFLSILLAMILMFYCYKQDFSTIKTAAYWGFLGIILFVIFTILDFMTSCSKDEAIKNEELNYFPYFNDVNQLTNIVSAISCLMLSFGYHIFAFSINDCMGEPQMKPFLITTGVSVFIVTVIYLLCGIMGYLIYPNHIEDTILDEMGDTILNKLLCISNMINVIMTFPVTFKALKSYYVFFIEVCITYIYEFFKWVFFNKRKNEQLNTRGESIGKKQKRQFFKDKKNINLSSYLEFLLVAMMFLSIFYLANRASSLKIVASLLGGTTGNIFSFIFPALFYIYFGKKRKFSLTNIVPILTVFFGFVGMIICITSTIFSIK